MELPKLDCYYQHRHGGLYVVSDISTSTVDNSKWVIYRHLYPFDPQTYHRPYDEWCEEGWFREISYEEFNNLLMKDKLEFRIEIAKAKAYK